MDTTPRTRVHWGSPLVLALVVIGLLACSSASTSGSGAVATTGATPTAVVHQHFKVGQTVVVSGWNIVVNSATETSGTADDLAPPSGDAYLEIDVVMKNVSNQTQAANIFDWNLRDSTGQQAQLGTLLNAADISGNIASGDQTHGQLVYEVATSGHTFTLEYSAPLSGSAPTVWDINV